MTTTTVSFSGAARAAVHSIFARCALFLGLALAIPAALAETLTGTVTNTATGQNLEGARVVLQGTNREVFTDSQGVYRLPDVAPGNVVLSVSYTGLTTV